MSAVCSGNILWWWTSTLEDSVVERLDALCACLALLLDTATRRTLLACQSLKERHLTPCLDCVRDRVFYAFEGSTRLDVVTSAWAFP